MTIFYVYSENIIVNYKTIIIIKNNMNKNNNYTNYTYYNYNCEENDFLPSKF